MGWALLGCGNRAPQLAVPQTAHAEPVPPKVVACPTPGLHLSLLGRPDWAQSLQDAAKKGPIVVRYARSPCHAELALLSCKVGRGRYSSEGQNQGRVTQVEAMHKGEQAPLMNAKDEAPGRYLLKRFEDERLGLPKARIYPRSRLSGDCEGATHVVTALQKGAAQLFEGPSNRPVLHLGEVEGCESAAGQKRRACQALIGIELTPIDEGPEASMVAIPASGAEPAFWIDRREVSALEYQRCVAAKACSRAEAAPGCTGDDSALLDHPMNCVKQADAAAYCAFVKKQLPTLEAWQRAAGSGRFPWGDAWPPPSDVANLADGAARRNRPYWVTIPDYEDGFAMTAPVGSYGSREGPEDMAGNVKEWTQSSEKGAFWVAGSSLGTAHPEALERRYARLYQPSTWSLHIGFRCMSHSAPKADPKPAPKTDPKPAAKAAEKAR